MISNCLMLTLAAIVDDVMHQLQQPFGQEAPLSITRGKVHDYLGMQVDFSQPGKVVFSVEAYIEQILLDCPNNRLGQHGLASTPVCSRSMSMQISYPPQQKKHSSHRVVTQLLYLSKIEPGLTSKPPFLSYARGYRRLTLMITRS